jgi:hypothetical protein
MYTTLSLDEQRAMRSSFRVILTQWSYALHGIDWHPTACTTLAGRGAPWTSLAAACGGWPSINGKWHSTPEEADADV